MEGLAGAEGASAEASGGTAADAAETVPTPTDRENSTGSDNLNSAWILPCGEKAVTIREELIKENCANVDKKSPVIGLVFQFCFLLFFLFFP